GAFSQVVTNLVMNSIKHGYPQGDQGQMRFWVRRDAGQVTLEYTDDGCGITPENLSKIFEPFFTTARRGGGTGLGLHITYNLVTQKLGGTIRCESEVGQYTKFIIGLPIEARKTSPL
ncbi:MAG: ATP-binding protein, partial [Anaerolineae bacterium]|nr:ATP-binding protein [Anaerolineae bacterium]